MADTEESPNKDQEEFWAREPGAKWVENEDLLDASMASVLEHLLAQAALKAGENVLDIGCGTGVSTIRAALAVGSDGDVTGVDIAEQMLTRARTRAEEAGVANIRFLAADAQLHAFPIGQFDVVISRFGVMFFADPVAAFANIARAVKPGGRMIFMAWGPLQDNPWFSVPRAAAIDRVGAPPPMEPHAPGPMGLSDAEYTKRTLISAGLSDVKVTLAALDLTPPGDVDQIAHFATYLGPAARILDQMEGNEADRAAVTKTVEEGMAPFVTQDGLRIPALLNVISATVR